MSTLIFQGGTNRRPFGYQEVVRRRRLQIQLEGLSPLEVRFQFVDFEEVV